MATRGIIAVQRADGWRGRYAHWDNNPERLVEVIGRLVKRDGITKAVTTLINDNQSWSVIDDQQLENDPNKDEGYKYGIIAGYGVIHTDMEPNDASAWFTEEDTELAWAENVFVIRDIGLEVLKVIRKDGDDVTIPHLMYSWDEIGKELVGA